jgi:hypothetical protein
VESKRRGRYASRVQDMKTLTHVLRRADELDVAAWALLPDPYRLFDSGPRLAVSLKACALSVEHGRAVRALISAGLHTTGIAIVRMQFEALARAMWLLYAASDEDVAKAGAMLTIESEQAAKNLPMAAKMVDALEGKGPPAAFQMMSGFKEAMLPALHSFMHVGLHPLSRHMQGYPEPLLVQVLWNSNALLLQTGIMLGVLTGDQKAVTAVRGLYALFADCLPGLGGPVPAQPS